jgi:hypothetical protein
MLIETGWPFTGHFILFFNVKKNVSNTLDYRIELLCIKKKLPLLSRWKLLERHSKSKGKREVTPTSHIHLLDDNWV